SRPHAGSSTSSSGAPSTSAAARQRIGRKRLPPANTECRIARWRFDGHASPGGSSRSSARSTCSRRVARDSATPPAATSAPVVILVLRGPAGIEGRRLPFPRRVLQDDLDGLLDLAELLVAEARELHALLEEGELFLEPAVLALELGHDRLEPFHRLLEALLLLHSARHPSSSRSAKSGPGSSFLPPSRTIAPISPWCSRTRMRSPTATSLADVSGARCFSRNATA